MAVDYFLKLDGIDGESQDSAHKNEIDVISWSWGEAQSGTSSTGGGGGAGKVSMQDFHFTMQTNQASPKLMLACANGQHIKSGILTGRKAGTTQQEYLVVTMKDLLISSFQTGASGDVPTDSISLNFSSIQQQYKAQKSDGTLGGAITAGWDLKANKAL